MKRMLCLIGIHTWSDWYDPEPHPADYMPIERVCLSCRKLQIAR